jgi:response regulator RpfG family c-di-GMP phosphodiesterase
MAGTQFDPEVVEAFVAEVARQDAVQPGEREPIDAPLQLVADRVRALLET